MLFGIYVNVSNGATDLCGWQTAVGEPVLEGIRLIGFSQKADRLAFSRAPAQLAERLHGMQEVRGSIPLSSTIFSSTWFS